MRGVDFTASSLHINRVRPTGFLGHLMSTTNEWPAHFPPQCPPADAADLSNTVFYLVEHNPPTAEDFRSARERDTFIGKPECERASLSCGLTREYILRLKDSIPRLKSMLVATSDLKAEHGKIKPTGRPGHHSMWLCAVALASAPTLFQVEQ